MNYQDLVANLSLGVGAVGVAVLIWGVLCAIVRLVRMEFRSFHGIDPGPERVAIRHLLGYYLLLGLEILVAADIIETLLEPTLEHIGVLGGIVIIRTIISFSLSWELSQGAPRTDA